ncbi:protein patched homolog 1-like isoform X2 [Gigantopelta aegis]|uniref:protein patched homolog 1-like isoform X2 n=1 Tax=Gigantopelta aegis TaxID=1735272 RepID=UPI001B88A02B|nr:protein patched homolog 1-like isoform X2 [Gigantopelta aegis]
MTMSTVSRRNIGNTVDPDLLTRTSWVNAELAYRQIKKGKADGNTCALWLRWHLQKYLFSVGCFIQLHCGKVLFLGLLLLSLCCVGLKTATLETNVQELWVEEGGRLERELKYTKETVGEGSGSTSELVIQTPKRVGANLLNVDSLSLHLQAVLKATKINVVIDGIEWKFSDICYATDFPRIEDYYVDSILELILPCVIITPLDCFWEGSKLLGPEDPVKTLKITGLPEYLTWKMLNPRGLVTAMKEYAKYSGIYFPVEALEEVFDRAGIGSAYQEKPCLNPYDPECPTTAPNKYNKQIPDLGGEMTNGCAGFATKYMHWNEDLIFGGVRKNKTGHIVKIEAFQSIIQLMGEKDLFEYHDNSMKVTSVDWSLGMAKQVLEAWQRNFSEILNKFTNDSSRDNVYAFSYTSLLDIMRDFSSVSIVRVALGYLLMFVYACVSLLKWNDAVNSQSGIGMAGVLLVSLSVAAGLGICSVLGITFNASTTQIIPFLALGLGVDDMFLIAHTHAENSLCKVPVNDQAGECLKRTGVTVLLTSISNMLAFFTAAIIPIPALRAFSLQAAILVLFNMGSILLIFPAIISLDMVRREDKRVDVLCCFQSPGPTQVIELQPQSREPEPIQREPSPPSTYSPPPSYSSVMKHNTITRSSSNGAHTVTMLAPEDGAFVSRNVSLPSACPSTTSSQQCLAPDEVVTCKDRCVQAQRECLTWSLTCFATNVYGPSIQRTPMKVFVVVFFFIFLIMGIWGTAQVKDGLDLTDLVPRDTKEFKFLEAQSKYFGFYNIFAVTQGNFDYPNNQKLMYDYHNAFDRVKKIIRGENGELPTFWLELFRQWLSDLQRAFDKDYQYGKFHADGWYPNATDEAILAYKLLQQTGNSHNPYDKDQVTRVRLVDGDGNIYAPAFYNYLTAWTSNDVMAYTASVGNFHPIPKTWLHDPKELNFVIPKSQPLIYTQLPFFLTNLSNTEDIISIIKEIRSICDSFSARGLPNYPTGVPFTFWEQYINLRFYMMLAILCVLAVTFIVLTVVLMNPWIAVVVVVMLAMILVELFGFMGMIGIKLSAVPAVILIMAVGIGVEFTLHMAVGFITAIGDRNRRMFMSLEHTFAPVVHGAVSTFLGIIMLVGAEFDFVIKYFFNVLAALVVIGLFNGLLLLPVLLAILGPNGEVQPKEDPDRLATPSPEPSPKPRERSSRIGGRRIYPRVPSDISLTTITEEPTQYSSHEIIVQPEIVVETTTIPHPSRESNAESSNSSTKYMTLPGSAGATAAPQHITRVTATATVKVEVHTPLPGSCTVDEEHSFKSKRRKLKEHDNSNSDSESNGSNKS